MNSFRETESVIADELRDFGFGKDGKFNEVQVVLALITTTAGLPITYQLFPGNVYEGHTLITMIQALKRQYAINNVLVVADRAIPEFPTWVVLFYITTKTKAPTLVPVNKAVSCAF